MNDIKNKTIYEAISGFSPSKKRTLMKSLLIVPLLIIFFTSWFIYIDITADIDKYNQQLYNMQKVQGEIFAAVISETYKRAKLQTDYIRRDIVNDLENYYKDNKDLMKKDYKSFDPSKPFYQILAKNIDNKFLDTDNDNDRIFIASRDAILLDSSYTHAGNSFMLWEDYINSYKYSKLLQYSIERLNYREKNLILWLDDRDDKNYTFLTEEDKDDTNVETFIKDQIESNKIDELRNFSLLTASYIFDHEDLFGVSEVRVGKSIKNDRLCIIQIFNIGDMMDCSSNMTNTITKYRIMRETIMEDGNESIRYKCISFSLLVFLEIVCFFGIWYLIEAYFTFHPVSEEESSKPSSNA